MEQEYNRDNHKSIKIATLPYFKQYVSAAERAAAMEKNRGLKRSFSLKMFQKNKTANTELVRYPSNNENDIETPPADEVQVSQEKRMEQIDLFQSKRIYNENRPRSFTAGEYSAFEDELVDEYDNIETLPDKIESVNKNKIGDANRKQKGRLKHIFRRKGSNRELDDFFKKKADDANLENKNTKIEIKAERKQKLGRKEPETTLKKSISKIFKWKNLSTEALVNGAEDED